MSAPWDLAAQAALVEIAAAHLAATDPERAGHLREAAGNLQKAIEALEDPEGRDLAAIYDAVQRGDDADL